MGRQRAATAAPGRGRRRDERALPGGVPPPHRGSGGGRIVRMAPEGWPFIAIGWGVLALTVFAALRWSGWWWVPAAALAVIAVWLLVFFRDPTRTGPRGDSLVISPADGKIVSIA